MNGWFALDPERVINLDLFLSFHFPAEDSCRLSEVTGEEVKAGDVVGFLAVSSRGEHPPVHIFRDRDAKLIRALFDDVRNK